MTDEGLPLAELLARAGDGDFIRERCDDGVDGLSRLRGKPFWLEARVGNRPRQQRVVSAPNRMLELGRPEYIRLPSP